MKFPEHFPIKNPRYPSNEMVSSQWGPRNSPFQGHSIHEGIDLRADHGDDVISMYDGETVDETGVDTVYGNFVKTHDSLGRVWLYGHLTDIAVRAGQRLRRRKKIGTVGSTGWATGPHLHLGRLR